MTAISKHALRLPTSLKQAAEACAREEGMTLDQFIVRAVAEKLSALKTADYFAERAARGEIVQRFWAQMRVAPQHFPIFVAGH